MFWLIGVRHRGRRLLSSTALCAALCLSAFSLSAFSGESTSDALAGQSTAELLTQSREAYTYFRRVDLSRALVTKGIVAVPKLGEALKQEHWHVRHCSLMTLHVLARDPAQRTAILPLVPAIAALVASDPSLGVRVEAARCLGAMAELGKAAQKELAQAAVGDKEDWVRMAAATALKAVRADLPVMLGVYDTMIRSTDKVSRAEGISKAGELHKQKIDISLLIPALSEVFRASIYDANFSEQTRVPAMELLNRLKVDTSELAPFITNDLATTWKSQENGYHPYQRMTLKILGQLGAHGAAAIPVLEAVIADPSKFGCDRQHPDYSGFISDSKESIRKIRAAMARTGDGK